jgi:hypothetical protein
MVRSMPIAFRLSLTTASEASQSVYPVTVMMLSFSGFEAE